MMGCKGYSTSPASSGAGRVRGGGERCGLEARWEGLAALRDDPAAIGGACRATLGSTWPRPLCDVVATPLRCGGRTSLPVWQEEGHEVAIGGEEDRRRGGEGERRRVDEEERWIGGEIRRQARTEQRKHSATLQPELCRPRCPCAAPLGGGGTRQRCADKRALDPKRVGELVREDRAPHTRNLALAGGLDSCSNAAKHSHRTAQPSPAGFAGSSKPRSCALQRRSVQPQRPAAPAAAARRPSLSRRRRRLAASTRARSARWLRPAASAATPIAPRSRTARRRTGAGGGRPCASARHGRARRCQRRARRQQTGRSRRRRRARGRGAGPRSSRQTRVASRRERW